MASVHKVFMENLGVFVSTQYILAIFDPLLLMQPPLHRQTFHAPRSHSNALDALHTLWMPPKQ